MSDVHGHGAPAPGSAGAIPPWRLVATLGFAGALAGGLIVTVYARTLPTIEAHRAAQVELAVREVLHQPARLDTLYLMDGVLRPAAAGEDVRQRERVFLGYDAAGAIRGAAITAAKPGFADVISLIFGLEPTTGAVLGLKILGHRETPGLGDKIERPAFTDQFIGASTPLAGVKAVSGAAGEVATITGATISSRAVVEIINEAVRRWRPLLQEHLQGRGP